MRLFKASLARLSPRKGTDTEISQTDHDQAGAVLARLSPRKGTDTEGQEVRPGLAELARLSPRKGTDTI